MSAVSRAPPPPLRATSWAGRWALAASLVLHGAGVGLSLVGTRTSDQELPARVRVIDSWLGSSVEVEAPDLAAPGANAATNPTAAAAAAEAAPPEPSPASTVTGTEGNKAEPEPAPPVTGEPQLPRAPKAEARREAAPSAKPRPPRPKRAQAAPVDPSAEAASAAERVEPSAASGSAAPAAGSFGSTGLPPGVRRLGYAFTRAIPAATPGDAAWRELPVGAVGVIRIELEVDAQGKLGEARRYKARPGEPDAPAPLQRMVDRTLYLLRAGQFALSGTNGAGKERLAIRVELRDEATDSEAGETVVQKKFDGASPGRPGKAYFRYGTGRAFEATVSIETR